MKFTLSTVAFFAASAAALDLADIALNAGPMLKKTQCALPCLYDAADALSEDGSTNERFNNICNNFDEVQEDAAPCLEKCSIEPQVKGEFLLLSALSTLPRLTNQ